MEDKDVLYYAVEIGRRMLVSGAEVSRVEDTIGRICRAYGAARVDVFTITSSMVVTLEMKPGHPCTLTRRITTYTTNLDEVDALNTLSRYICANCPSAREIKEKLAAIRCRPVYPFWQQVWVCGMIAGAFALFFDGNGWDALAATLVGLFLKLWMRQVEKLQTNGVFFNLLCAFAAGAVAILLVWMGLGQNLDKIIIGNVMLLIPGVLLTNSMRDLISGDLMSGMLRFCEAIVIAVSVASGFVLATMLLGGVLL